MTGNIANPNTYKYLCELNINNNCNIINYIRCSIGSGNGCLTTSNVSCHYPIATLIDSCYIIKYNYDKNPYCPKIIADGGIRNYSDVIKALALGADYVMIGSLFAQCIESAGEKYYYYDNNKENKILFNINDYKSISLYKNTQENIIFNGYLTDNKINENISSIIKIKDTFPETYKQILNECKEIQTINNLYVKFFGMASADGQKSINGTKTKTAEGLTKILPVIYTLNGWVDNMINYLKSAMSYTNSKNLKHFIGETQLIINSINEINSVNK